MSIEREVIRKALVLLGVNSGGLESSGNRANKAENLCEEFAAGAIEETFLAAKWPFALKMVRGAGGAAGKFTAVQGLEDCMKVAVITPSNLEWYIEGGKFYFKGSKLDALFYHSKTLLQKLLKSEYNYNQAGIENELQIPESFRLLSALSLACQVAFALYSDSLFVESFRKQYHLKLDEVRKIYTIDYNLVNSGEL